MNRTTILAGASLVIGVPLAVACSREEPPAVYPTPQGYTATANASVGAPTATGVPMATAPAGQPTAYPPATSYPPGANPPGAAPYPTQPQPAPTATQPQPQPTAQPTPTAAPTLFDQGAAAAIKLALHPRVGSEAKGMKEDGPTVAGLLQEGSVLTQEFILNPGRCYTILGQGLPTISQLDLTIAIKPLVAGAAPVVLQASNSQGPNASIASGKNCYKNPLPIAGTVILTVKATRGSGPAGAQVYSK